MHMIRLVLVVFGLAAPAVSLSAAAVQPDWSTLLTRNGAALDAIASDADAKKLFESQVASSLGMAPTFTRPSSPGSGSDDPEIVAFMADLAAWRLATMLGTVADTSNGDAVGRLIQDRARLISWLGNEQWPQLARAVALARVLSEAPPDTAVTVPPGFDSYAAALDMRYPALASGPDSWTAVAVQSGWAGVASRLAQTWSQNGQPSPESEQQHALEAAYVERRLRPVFRAALVGAAVLAEADAARRATADADRLGRAEEERRLTRGQRRLCGTWQWTVHNHQNHQDHKFPMVFPPPGEPVNGASGPVSVVVRGDTVFLRWTYPTGYQEDSLLFTGEGNRLEGSFINSGGAWGSITGKRVAPCKG